MTITGIGASTRKHLPFFFWQHFLDKGVVPPLVSDIIKKVLTIPIGSADAERSFSILFHIRNKRRSRLTPDHLEDFLRIRFNGPKNLEEFASIKYAKLWVAEGHLKTDDTRWKKERPSGKGSNELGEVTAEVQKNYLDGSVLF